MSKTNYIYEEAESMYLQDPDNAFYYYKRQTPKQTVEIKKMPHKEATIDIYNDPKYYNVDTDSEIDMDDMDMYPYDAEDAEQKEEEDDDFDDLLSKLKTHLSTISKESSILPPSVVPSVEKPSRSVKITKKNRKEKESRNGKGKGRYTKHAYKAPAKHSY